MKPIKLRMLITIGEIGRYLFDPKADWPIHGDRHILSGMRGLLSSLEQLKFKVTLESARDLLQIEAEFGKYPGDAKLSPADAARLTDIMGKLRHTLSAEANTLIAYVLTEKRFDVRRLVEQPEAFLGKGTFEKLPLVAQLDIREAGKCIGFELPTAAAFHLLRATEDTLRSYYKVFVTRGRKDKATWGELVQALRAKKRKPKPDETLLNHLDHIRKNFRNPTDHPEMIYDTDGVQDLFSLVADVLNRMAKELPGKKFEPLFKALLAVSPKPQPLAVSPPSEAKPSSE